MITIMTIRLRLGSWKLELKRSLHRQSLVLLSEALLGIDTAVFLGSTSTTQISGSWLVCKACYKFLSGQHMSAFLRKSYSLTQGCVFGEQIIFFPHVLNEGKQNKQTKNTDPLTHTDDPDAVVQNKSKWLVKESLSSMTLYPLSCKIW